MKKISLITENAKELKDFIEILNNLYNQVNFEINIILLTEIYQDEQHKLLSKIKFRYKILKLINRYNSNFTKLSLLKKIVVIKDNQKNILNFVQDSQLILSGVQIVFQRIMFCDIKRNKLPIKTIVYHRHLLGDDGVGTNGSKFLYNSFSNFLENVLNLSGLLVKNRAVGFADKYLVLGEINKHYLISKGINENIIECVGSIEYDSVENFKNHNVKNNDNNKLCYITGASEWIGDIQGEAYQVTRIKNLIEFVELNSNYDLTIRIHPRENSKKYEKLQEKYNFIKLQYPSKNHIFEDLQPFNVLISCFSTLLFESVLIDKKTIFYILNEELHRYKDIIEMGNIRFISNNIDLQNEINNDLASVDISKFITYDKNEKAIDRIVDLLKKELND